MDKTFSDPLGLDSLITGSSPTIATTANAPASSPDSAFNWSGLGSFLTNLTTAGAPIAAAALGHTPAPKPATFSGVQSGGISMTALIVVGALAVAGVIAALLLRRR